MACFKCGSTYLSSRNYVLRELAKGSPKRGKNKKYTETQVREIRCKDCQSTEMIYK